MRRGAALGRILAGLVLPLLLSACTARPWGGLSRGGPPGPRPLDLPPAPRLEAPPEDPGAAGPVAEEEPAGEAPIAAPTGEAVPGPPRDLTLDGALVSAILHNPTLEVTRFGSRIAGTAIPEELAAFDPRMRAGILYSDSTRQLTAVQTFTFQEDGEGGEQPERPRPPNFLEQQGLNVSSTLSTLFPTGTALSLTGIMDRSDTNFTEREYEGAWSLQVTHPLAEGSGREVNLIALRQAQNRSVQSEWQLRRAVLDLVVEVERSYWELVLAQEVVGIREFGVRLAEEQLELNRDLVDTGRAVRSAVLSARAERASRQADLADARGRVRSLSVRLLRLLDPKDGSDAGLSPGPDMVLRAVDPPVVERVDVDSEASVRRALETRPEVFDERIEALNRRLDVFGAEDALGPSVDLVASYGRTSLGLELGGGLDHLFDDSRFDNYTVGLEIDLPLVGRGELARYRRARLSQMRSEAVLRDTALLVDEQVRTAAIDVETQWLRLQASREAVESRREELRIERDRYEVGMARNLDVLEVQRFLIQSRVDAVTARVRYLQALAALYRADGTLLERRGITFAGLRPDPQAVPTPQPPPLD